MTRLDAATRSTTKLARNMAKKERAKPKTWNGKKIISLSEWYKKERPDAYDWQDYYPDQMPQIIVAPDDDKFIEKYQKWLGGFIEFMEASKPKSYGEYKCRNCILNPDTAPLTTTIRDAIVKTFQSNNGRPLEFPCNVINIFKCPYEDKGSTAKLLVIGYMWKIVDAALKYNIKSTRHKHTTYLVDFKKSRVAMTGYDGFDSIHSKISDVLDKLKFPRVENTNHKDLYDILTTRDKLKSILEEYRDSPSFVAEKNMYEPEYVDYIKHNLDHFLDLFEKIKNHITLEDLRDTDGETPQYVKEQTEKYAKFLAGREQLRITLGQPAIIREKETGPCFSCGEQTRIRCKNCGVWMCLQHWEAHGVQAHNYTEQTN